MAYNEQLTDRLREALESTPGVEEKKMFRGVTFMVNGKMCICVSGEQLMCRIDPDRHEEALTKKGCSTMRMKGRDYLGFVLVAEEGFRSGKDFSYWLALCLEFNKKAKAAPKKKSRALLKR